MRSLFLWASLPFLNVSVPSLGLCLLSGWVSPSFSGSLSPFLLPVSLHLSLFTFFPRQVILFPNHIFVCLRVLEYLEFLLSETQDKTLFPVPTQEIPAERTYVGETPASTVSPGLGALSLREPSWLMSGLELLGDSEMRAEGGNLPGD